MQRSHLFLSGSSHSRPTAFVFILLLLLAGALPLGHGQSANEQMDYNRDGVINQADLLRFVREWQKPVTPGDPVPLKYGVVGGNVYLGSGDQVIPDGLVILRQNGKNLHMAPVTQGSYTFSNIPTGTYVLFFDHSTYSYADVITVAEGNNSSDIRAIQMDYFQSALRSFGQKNISAGEVYMAKALAASPQDLERNAYMSVVRLLALVENPTSGMAAVLHSMQIQLALFGSSVFPDEYPDASATYSEITKAMVDTLVPAINESLANVAKVKSNPDFRMYPQGFEKWIDPLTEIDASDVMLFEAFLNALKFEIYFLYSYQSTVNAAVIEKTESSSLETLLKQFPTDPALQSGYKSAMQTSRTFLDSALNLAKTALDAIAKEADPQGDDLFVATEEEALRHKEDLTDVQTSLKQNFPIPMEAFPGSEVEVPLYAGALFTNPLSRKMFPQFRENHPILETFPDPTFGGLLPGMTKDLLSRLLPCTYPLTEARTLPPAYLLGYSEYHEGMIYAYTPLDPDVSSFGLLRIDSALKTIETLPLPPQFSDGQVIGMTSDGKSLILLVNDNTHPQLVWYDDATSAVTKTVSLPEELTQPQFGDFANLSDVAYGNKEFVIGKNEWGVDGYTFSLYRISAEGKILSTLPIQCKDLYIGEIVFFNGSFWIQSEDALMKINLQTGAVIRVYHGPDAIGQSFAYKTGLGLIYNDFDEERGLFVPILHIIPAL